MPSNFTFSYICLLLNLLSDIRWGITQRRLFSPFTKILIKSEDMEEATWCLSVLGHN